MSLTESEKAPTTATGAPAVVSESDPRFQIAASRRILHREGLDSQVGGHVSLRVPGEEAFLVTPFQYFDETLPEHVSKVGFDLTVIEQGTLPASPGINFHASIYAARTDVNCVIHTHAKNMSVLSTTGEPYGVYYDYASLLLDDVVPWIDDPNLVPSEEGDLMVAALGGKKALLMGHHGSLHVGDTLERVTMEALIMELCAGYQLAAMAVGGKPLDRQIAESYRGAYLKNEFREQMWIANYRRLLRSDPDLFATLKQD
ncbi:class II aldolase/adducin family protein [Pseudonocardia sp. N23]|uniref:class II aldolase/adducin family protein n=1 Tax=Pseudonocardia sp. N23 TaxID=1987376 RepID=UPI000BFC08C4|nr:class II aldolase/adducin family protein [Pseudonocardia sp. N23]GAY08324.1 ribulose-5-phosphate 4-epimerase and related epimerases and aldolases [Pseudonocardia sp. N23]